jgi:hypothetical protein
MSLACIMVHYISAFYILFEDLNDYRRICAISFDYKPDYAVKAGEPLRRGRGSTKV